MLWFLRGIRRGIVTTRYPRRIDGWVQGLPSPPAFRGELLTPELAAELAERCTPGALWLEGPNLVLDLGTCTGCGQCSAIGDGAVAPSGEFELATRERTALLKRIRIGGAR